jgi:predicted metal-dependent phosphoesterase TrpH
MTSLRIAAHVHSSWSYDAEWSLQDLASAFSRRRYNAVLMSEHDRSFDQQRWLEYRKACEAASTPAITLIPGIEYEDSEGIVHIPVWGDDVPFLGCGRPTLELLRAARAEGAVAVFAHPWRRNAISRYEPEWAPLLSAVEVWNRKYDGMAPRREARSFAAREGLKPFVSLDFHGRRQFFPLAMSVVLEDSSTTTSLIEAIHGGRCKADFLGRSAMCFTGGFEGATLRYLEAARQMARKLIRRR